MRNFMKPYFIPPMLVALLIGLPGCPGGSDASGAPVDTCQKTGQQCRLGNGKLGVCTPAPDGDLRCTPQH